MTKTARSISLRTELLCRLTRPVKSMRATVTTANEMAARSGGAMDPPYEDATPSPTAARVAVCIVTFRRPDMLVRLLEAIGNLEVPPGAEVEVVVVDNDVERPVRSVVEDLAARIPLHVRYAAEPRPGVSFARNAAIAEATGSDYIAFVDDDMTVRPDWLAALLRTQRITGAAAVAGPVEPAFAYQPPRWLAEVFGLCYVRPTPGRPLHAANAGNLLLDLRVLKALRLGFGLDFSRMGGEDTQLISDLAAAGSEIVWAPDAVVMEHIPAPRMSVGWLFRRWFRYGVIDSHVGLRRRPGFAGRTEALARGALRVAGGSLLMLPGLVAASWHGAATPMRRVYTIARGLGMIAGTLGWRPRAYGT
jgi:succinoglycan biosynthesis protein ExoM